MRLLKLWSSEQGSAVTEFVFVVVPITILVIPLFSLLGIMHTQLVTGQLLISTARSVSRADLDEASRGEQLLQLIPDAQLSQSRQGSSCWNQVQVEKRIAFLGQYLKLNTSGWSACEIW